MMNNKILAIQTIRRLRPPFDPDRLLEDLRQRTDGGQPSETTPIPTATPEIPNDPPH